MALIAVLTAAPRPAVAQQQLIVNGGFETGNLTGWSTADVLDPNSADTYNPGDPTEGGFTAQSGATAPFSGLPTLGPDSGAFYALDDMTAPGEHALYQNFVVPAGTVTYTVSFDLYNYDWSGIGGAVNAAGFDYTSGGAWQGPSDPNPADANQYVEVDLLNESLNAGSAFVTDPADIAATLYGPGVDPQAALGENPEYQTYEFVDVIGGAGLAQPESMSLRFAEVDNQFPLNVGVDDVSFLASDTTPEPGSIGLLALPLFGLAIRIARARRTL
jgi:hypothetical protein